MFRFFRRFFIIFVSILSQCFIFNPHIHISRSKCFAFFFRKFFHHFRFEFFTMFHFQSIYTFPGVNVSLFWTFFHHFYFKFVTMFSIFNLRIHIPRTKCLVSNLSQCFISNLHFRTNLSQCFIFNHIYIVHKCLAFSDVFHHFCFNFVTSFHFQSPYTRFQLTLVITFLLFSSYFR